MLNNIIGIYSIPTPPVLSQIELLVIAGGGGAGHFRGGGGGAGGLVYDSAFSIGA